MIKDNIVGIKSRITRVCVALNKDEREITLVAVSKNRTASEIKEVIDSGLIDIGENRIQEALLKYQSLASSTYNLTPVRWHMVGHLQTNKAKDAVKIFDLIHSVDSLHLALEIDKQAKLADKVQDILIEVNVSGEPSKFGLNPDTAIEIVKEITRLKNIKISGLMTVAPIVNDPEDARPYFRSLKGLLDKINRLRVVSYELRVLSMGMTDDFEVAISEGSNMIRLGRAIFEN